MAITQLAVDNYGKSVPLLATRALGGKPQAVTSTTSTAFLLTLPDNGAPGAVGLYATQDMYVAFGASNVTAAATAAAHDAFIPAGGYREFAVAVSRPYIAAIRATADGTLYITQLGGPLS